MVREDGGSDDDGGIPLLGMGFTINREEDQREIFGHLIPGPSASDDALWLQDALAVVDTAINQFTWVISYFTPATTLAKFLIVFAPYVVDEILEPPNSYQRATRPLSDLLGARGVTDRLQPILEDIIEDSSRQVDSFSRGFRDYFIEEPLLTWQQGITGE